MDSKERAILKTLLYAEIFDYPLKKQEIFNFLISDKKTDEEIILQKLSAGKTPFKSKKGYFFIKGKEGLVELREKRGKASREKLSIAKKIIKKVNFIKQNIGPEKRQDFLDDIDYKGTYLPKGVGYEDID